MTDLFVGADGVKTFFHALAGADALELNVYYIATDPDEPGTAVEKRTLDILTSVKESVTIPVAIKLSPFFSSPGHFAKQLDALGAAGVILFNRFYQPDIDIEELEATHRLDLSNSTELRLRLRWAAILHGHLKADIAEDLSHTFLLYLLEMNFCRRSPQL